MEIVCPWQLSINKIYGYDLLRQIAAHRGHPLVLVMVRIPVETVVVSENGNQTGIERPIEMQDISPHAKADDPVDDRRQRPQAFAMVGPHLLARFGLIFPTNNVR